MATGERASRKIIPFPGRRVDEPSAPPLRLAIVLVVVLLAGQALEASRADRRPAAAEPPGAAIAWPRAPLP